MFISVVIPAYNEEAYLGECLAALTPASNGGPQNYPADGYEIVVADNNSTDCTAEIVRAYGARVVPVREKGVVHARQGGATAARGDVLASTDADTLVDPNWLAAIAARLQADDTLAGLMGPVYLRAGPAYARAYQALAMNGWQRLFQAIGRPCFAGHNFAARRADFLAIGGFDTRMRTGEDMNLSLRLRRRGRIGWEPRMSVRTSGRRVADGAWANLSRGCRDYLLIALLERGTGSEFRDIR